MVCSSSFSGNCAAKFSKILKKFDMQDYADSLITTDDANITDWGAHAARVHVSAASLKQSIFHHEDTKNDKIIESGKQEPRKGWTEGLELGRPPP